MITNSTEIKLFTGNSNRALAEAIAAELGIPLSEIEVGHFSDGETSVHISETVRGRDVFIIQSTCAPVNEIAGCPNFLNAIAKRAIETCSPVVRSISSSRR